jgi:hypothetical protein
MATITLTRLLSEIKKTEEKLTEFQNEILVTTCSNKTGKTPKHETKEEFIKLSQSRWDAWIALQEKYLKMKELRNKANIINYVSISGELLTLDAAISKKALVEKTKATLMCVQRQWGIAIQQETKANDAVQAAIDKAVASATGSGSALSDAQVEVFKKMYETSLGITVIAGPNIKTAYDALMQSIAAFEQEVDFALSEANATILVEM